MVFLLCDVVLRDDGLISGGIGSVGMLARVVVDLRDVWIDCAELLK